MREQIFNLKLQRAIWVAMLNQSDFSNAVNCFEIYKKDLKEAAQNEDEEKIIAEELSYSNKIFIEEAEKLAKKFFDDKNYANALICYKYIFDENPDNKKNINNYITCLDNLKQYDLELYIAKKLIKIDNSADNNKLISKIYEKNEDFDNAVYYYDKYFKLSKKPKKDEYDYNTLGCIYFNAYIKKSQQPIDAQKSLENFKNALAFNKTSKTYLKNTIVAAMKAKNYAIEKPCWDTYIKCGYLNAEDEFTLSASCMRNGDIEGWRKYYGSRFRKNEPTVYPKINKPEWNGEQDLSNSTLLVHYEQGYGDNFLMFGYMPRLVKLAKHVIYYIQNNAYDLVKNNEFGVEVLCHNINKDVNSINFDYHIPCMSIPVALKLNKDNIGVGGGYIKPSAKKVKQFAEKYFNNGLYKIGIAFEGVASNKKRDIPLEKLMPLDNLDNVQLYCFTKDVIDERLACFKKNKVINIAKDFNTFNDTAAAIENTDIIISSDNCVLNLAGAMGKKTIGIYNYHYEFRWYNLKGKDCGWYKSVIPVVNNEYNDWDLSIKKALDILQHIRN